MSSKPVLAYVTFPSEEVAEKICGELVTDGTIACANIFPPMRSIYKWEGTLHKEREWAAVLKTTDLKTATLKEKIRATHPYENPCLVVLPISDGSPEFLKWIDSQTV